MVVNTDDEDMDADDAEDRRRRRWTSRIEAGSHDEDMDADDMDAEERPEGVDGPRGQRAGFEGVDFERARIPVNTVAKLMKRAKICPVIAM